MLVRTAASVISVGTERMLVSFGRANWIDKARSQPDKVRQVLRKVATDGLGPTIDAVNAKLDQPIPLGYCNAGTVVAVGAEVEGFSIGDLVVSNGPHAEFVRVPPTLAARVPNGVPADAAAFAPLAAIALNGLRLAGVTLGETVVVFGLGLIGQLAVQLARASGCRVIGVDREPDRVALAERWGAIGIVAGADRDVASAVEAANGGLGVDAVLLTLASDSSDPVRASAAMSRKRGRIVLVGVTGLTLNRDDFYRKELSFQVACSYGPGRYDPAHEDGAVDYPFPYVRWTEGRNFAAVVQLMAEGRLAVEPLVTARLPVTAAADAYDRIVSDRAGLGYVLTYPTAGSPVSPVPAPPPRVGESAPFANVGVLGAGGFAAKVLIPALRDAGATLQAVMSVSGVTATTVAKRFGFSRVGGSAEEVLSAADIDIAVVATRHDSHARFVTTALTAGKHVFVEKPLALTLDEVADIERALASARSLLCVGFNRRFARDTLALRTALAGRRGPLRVAVTVNAGAVPPDHWTKDRAIGGGRLLGEGCHFIDLARALVGAPICSASVVPARLAGVPVDDAATITLAFDDGSFATVDYLSNGHPGYPKERVEVFFDGSIVRLDNFRRVAAWGVSIPTPNLIAGQDKGHRELVRRFVEAVRQGKPSPIPTGELVEVAKWSIAIAEAARVGGGAVTRPG
jgi:predicted dehydrogenase/threonine dehydrogenase-like Zn-dependent dehydrogenase